MRGLCGVFERHDKDHKGILVTKPFTCWTKQPLSVMSRYCTIWIYFRRWKVLLDQEKDNQIANNCHILTCNMAAVVDSALLSRCDCDSTIGDDNRGNILVNDNPGNLLALLIGRT